MIKLSKTFRHGCLIWVVLIVAFPVLGIAVSGSVSSVLQPDPTTANVGAELMDVRYV